MARRRKRHGKHVGKRNYSTGARELVIVNPEDADSPRGGSATHRYVLWVGQTGTTYLLIWASGIDDASEHMIDWVVDNAPGYLADDLVQEEYRRAIAEGKSEEEAQEEAESDTTMFGHNGIHYLMSDDWGIEKEDPSRAWLLAFAGRDLEPRAKGVDKLAKKRARTFRYRNPKGEGWLHGKA